MNRTGYPAVMLAGCLLAAAGFGLCARAAGAGGREAQYGWTELHVAARDDNVEAAARLANPQSVAARERHQRTPLHIAATFGRARVAEVLVAAGADVHAEDEWGVTPLRRAELMQQTRNVDRSEIIDVLRRAGAQR